MGDFDLPRTTDELYGKNGKPLHAYTVKEAIHDEAVLGFMNKYLCDSDMDPKKKDVNPAMHERKSHMSMVLNTILRALTPLPADVAVLTKRKRNDMQGCSISLTRLPAHTA